MSLSTGISLLQVVSTFFMIGLIWVIQRVHYPSMHWVESDHFSAFEKSHCDAIGSIVAPCMVIEAASAVGMCWWCRTSGDWLVLGSGWLLLLVIWGSTFWIQVPMHEQLRQGKNSDTINRLVRTNWIRTVAWSIRGGLTIWMHLLVLRNGA
jgi:hypothetical protein